MPDDWARSLTNRVAAQIKELRGSRSVQWLEDRTVELGSRISRSTISELETGQRKSITLADVIVLAAALDVSVVDLIYPGTGKDVVEVLPGVHMTKAEAAEVFGGSRQLNSKLIKMAALSAEMASLGMEEIIDLRNEIRRMQGLDPIVIEPPGKGIDGGG
jgi:hypothetical protein